MSRVITEKVEITDKMLKPSKRLIDVDDLIKIIDKYYDADECNGSDVAMDIMSDISSLPSAQPEIIRCKDCKNWDTTWTNDFSPNYHYCPMVDGGRKGDWYCADAERRADE